MREKPSEGVRVKWGLMGPPSGIREPSGVVQFNERTMSVILLLAHKYVIRKKLGEGKGRARAGQGQAHAENLLSS